MEHTLHIIPDWTLAIELAVFLASFALLHYGVFRPALKVLDRRRRMTIEATSKAEVLTAEADALEGKHAAAVSEALATFQADRARRIHDAHLKAEAMVAESRQEAQWFMETTDMFIESSEESIIAEMNARAEELAQEIKRSIVEGRPLAAH